MTDPLVALHDVTATYADSADPALRGVTLAIGRGEVVLLAGPSGSGKSTLAMTMNGLVPHAIDADLTGRVTVTGTDTAASSPAQLSRTVGMVFQDPDAQVVTGSVYDEVAFGPENLCVPEDEVRDRVADALRIVGLWERREEDPAALSGGGRQRLAIAAALAMQTPLIVLDEPTANLDPQGARSVYDALGQIVASGETSLLLIEHDLDAALPLATRMVVLDRTGHPAFDDAPQTLLRDHAAELEELGVGLAPAHVPRQTAGPADPILTTHSLTLARGGRTVLHGVSVDIPRGSTTAIVGPNGAGKTTLAQAIAGVIRTPRGTVTRETDVRFVFQNPEHQFVAHTVREELAHGVRGLPRREAAERVASMLARLDLTAHADRHPFRLSGGQKRRLSLGAVTIGMRPGGVLVLDEPLYGQDRVHTASLLAMLEELHEQGVTIVVVTHDLRLVASHATHVIEMNAGRVTPVEGLPKDPTRPTALGAAGVERRRFLERRDPLATLLAVFPGLVALIFTRDIVTPAVFVGLAYVMLLVGVRPSRRLVLWLLGTLPAIGAVLAVGFGMWTGFDNGVATALRLVALLALALIPGLASDGVDTVRALTAHLRIPYRVGYSALAALRFVPRFRHEFGVIRAAHRVRGSRALGPLAYPRLLVPLLASGIRHAERVALAMDARAFGAFPSRTERRRPRWRVSDTVFVAVAWILTAAAMVAGPLVV